MDEHHDWFITRKLIEASTCAARCKELLPAENTLNNIETLNETTSKDLVTQPPKDEAVSDIGIEQLSDDFPTWLNELLDLTTPVEGTGEPMYHLVWDSLTESFAEDLLELDLFSLYVFPGNHWVSYIWFSYIVFLLGVSGILFNYKNFLVTMLNIELMYLGILSSFAIIAKYTYSLIGQIYALLILILAASESAVGLGLLIVAYKYRKSLQLDDYKDLYGG